MCVHVANLMMDDGVMAQLKGDTFLVTLRGGIYKSISHLPKLLSIYMKNSKK